jgi:hypothetical protein
MSKFKLIDALAKGSTPKKKKKPKYPDKMPSGGIKVPLDSIKDTLNKKKKKKPKGS